MKYSINLIYCPGKKLVIADTSFQAYLPEKLNDCVAKEFEISALLTIPMSKDKLAQLKEHFTADLALQQLMDLATDGWPNNKFKVPALCSPYWTFRDQIIYHDGVVFKEEQIVIPKSMQPEMLKLIHSSDLGVEKCKRRARDIMYWPGMSEQTEDIVSSCAICNIYHQNNTKEPLLLHSVPDHP